MFCAGDEVAERVVLVFLFARPVPGFAQLTAAAHVSDGKRHAPIEQAQARMGEPRVKAFTIGAVTIHIQRRRLAQGAALDHHADWHPGAIRGRGPQALTDVIVGIERPQDRGFLEYALLAGVQCQLTYLCRTIQRLIAQTDIRTFELKAVLHIKAVGGVW